MAEASDNERTVVEKIIAELNSEYGDSMSATRPYKSLFNPDLEQVATNLVSNSVTATIAISAEYQSPYGDNWRNERRFDVTHQDIESLAGTAPKFRESFSRFAARMTTQLAADHETSRKAVEAWSDAGLPTTQATSIRRPLTLRR